MRRYCPTELSDGAKNACSTSFLSGLAKQASVLDLDSAASAAADRISTEGDAARAARITAGAQGIAARLQHAAASSVPAAAGDAAPVLGQLALGVPTAKVALEDHLTIPQTAAVADTPLEHLAEILKCSACDIIIAAAGDLQTTFTLLKPQRASRKNARIPNHRRWSPGGRVVRIGGIPIHQNCRHGVPPPRSRHSIPWQTLHTRWQSSRRLHKWRHSMKNLPSQCSQSPIQPSPRAECRQLISPRSIGLSDTKQILPAWNGLIRQGIQDDGENRDIRRPWSIRRCLC